MGARCGSVQICELFVSHATFHAVYARDLHGRTALDVCRGGEVRTFLGRAMAGRKNKQSEVASSKVESVPMECRKVNPIRLWLTEIDEHLQIYSGAFEGLGFKSPGDLRKHWHHRDDTHLQDLFRQIGIRKLGHKRLLQRWLSHPKPILSDL